MGIREYSPYIGFRVYGTPGFFGNIIPIGFRVQRIVPLDPYIIASLSPS